MSKLERKAVKHHKKLERVNDIPVMIGRGVRLLGKASFRTAQRSLRSS